MNLHPYTFRLKRTRSASLRQRKVAFFSTSKRQPPSFGVCSLFRSLRPLPEFVLSSGVCSLFRSLLSLPDIASSSIPYPASLEIAEACWWLLLRSALRATPNYLPAPPSLPLYLSCLPALLLLFFFESGRETGADDEMLVGRAMSRLRPPAAKGHDALWTPHFAHAGYV